MGMEQTVNKRRTTKGRSTMVEIHGDREREQVEKSSGLGGACREDYAGIVQQRGWAKLTYHEMFNKGSLWEEQLS